MSSGHRPSGVFARGVAMGIVEVIPGVSGGTIAFITGIYERLLAALASWSPRSLVAFVRGEDRGSHDLGFLALLATGIAVGYLATARVIGYLLDVRGLLVWSFFFGLIAGSAWLLGRRLGLRYAATFGVAGALIGAVVATLGAAHADPGYVQFFLGGGLATAAWLLPGVSGSFVLLLLGLYEPFVAAVNGLQLDILAAAGAGTACGVLLFARVVTLLLRRFRRAVLATLTGLMAGSLLRLWPWRADDALLAPEAYGLATGNDPMLLGAALAALAGVGCTALMMRLGGEGP